MSGFSFAVGKKKTPFQKHKEQEEEKQRKEALEAAKLYEDFVESFAEDPAEKGPKAFVRGEVIQPGQRPSDSGEPPQRAGRYVPKFLPPSMAAVLGVPESKPKLMESAVSPMPKPATGSKGKQPRQIDAMLENLKREQEKREERQRMRSEAGGALDLLDDEGSFDDGDPYTTNLYIGNLAPEVNEEILKKEFGRFGNLASVKIMWPRDDDQRRRGRNCGFVAYMNREEAQRAKDDLNGIMLHDNDLRIGWGKSIPIPAAPMFVLNVPGGAVPARGAAIGPPGSMGTTIGGPWGHSGPHDPSALSGPDIEVQFPSDERIRYIIDTMAVYVMQDGCAFEQAVMLKEQNNPEFRFLFDLTIPEHVYYRWRLYSLANEDSLRSWRVEPFCLLEDTARWIPPAMTLAGSAHQTAAQRGGEAKDKDKPLSDMQRDRFEDLLRSLTVERKDICDAMIFALDNADSAFEIVEILTDALTLPETAIPTKVARLFLTSDVLHNSTAPVRNASRYRSHLETSLPDIFESLQETYRACDSRMTQEGLRRHVLRVLRMWRSWSIFSDDFLNGLQATFLRGTSALSSKKAGNPSLAAELEELDNDRLDTRCRRNGLSKKGGREMQIQRLLELQSYLNGGVSDWPAPIPEPVVKEEIHVPEPTGNNRPVLNPDASMELFQDIQPEAPQATPRLPTAAPVSKWTLAEDLDTEQTAIPVSKWVAQEAAMQAVKEEEELLPPLPAEAPPRPPAPAPVSKWTLVDYDEDNPPADLDGQDGGNLFSGASGDTPVMDEGASGADTPTQRAAEESRSGQPALPLEAPGPERKAADLRNDAAEEERRQKLRQVELAVMMFREQLEENPGGKTKAQVDAEVTEHRARLIADAEQSSKAETSAKSDSRSGRVRAAEKGKVRDADKRKDTVEKSKKQGKADTRSSSKDDRPTRRESIKDDSKLSRRASDLKSEQGSKRRRSRSPSLSSRSSSRSPSRDYRGSRKEEKSSRNRSGKAKEKEPKSSKAERVKSKRSRSHTRSRSPELRSSKAKSSRQDKEDQHSRKRRSRSRSRDRSRRKSRSRSRSRDRKSRKR
ncbi:hypothetical protein ABBQ38_013163 [Trebouxia sp. C0009 RCD-2024]